MMLKETTIADGPQYRRVLQVRDSINQGLIDKLIKRGADPNTIVVEYEGIDKGGRCCPQVKVTAYGTPTKSTKTNKTRLPEIGVDDKDQ